MVPTVITYLFTYFLTCLLTFLLYGAEPFLRINRFSASQEIPHILWNAKVHYRIQKCPPPVPIVSHLDPVHTPHSTSRRSIIILYPIYAWVSQLIFLLQVSPPKTCIQFSFPHTRYIPRPSHSSRFYHPNKLLGSSM
jgi:hypothetical protein